MEALTRHPRQQRFIAPLGVGARLQSGGVPAEKITELGRDEIIGINGVKYAAEPALHLSAHWTHDRNKTLQASCALADAFTGAAIPATANPSPPSVKKTAVSTSPLSKSTLRRCDAANSGWRNTHMFPDQAVQSALDVNASIMVPIHWSVFNLGRTPWKQSIHRVDKIAAERNVRLDVPGMDEKYTPQTRRTDKWGKSVE